MKKIKAVILSLAIAVGALAVSPSPASAAPYCGITSSPYGAPIGEWYGDHWSLPGNSNSCFLLYSVDYGGYSLIYMKIDEWHDEDGTDAGSACLIAYTEFGNNNKTLCDYESAAWTHETLVFHVWTNELDDWNFVVQHKHQYGPNPWEQEHLQSLQAYLWQY